MKRGKRALSLRAASVCLAALFLSTTPLFAGKRSEHGPRIVASSILEDLQQRKKERPDISPRELAEYANSLLGRKGFNYDFDACAILEANRKRGGRVVSASSRPEFFDYKIEQVKGPVVDFQIIDDAVDDEGGMCGECYFAMPLLGVTKDEMLLLAEGRSYRLKRPKEFTLDEAFLVDDSMRNVSRTWQLPFASVPSGVSADGSKLYVESYEGQGPDELLLELTEDGGLKFRARADVALGGRGEWIEEHPKDEQNAYLSFMQFRVGGKSYIIKFTAPCT